MSNRAYTIDDLAKECNRTRDWASDNWRSLVKAGTLPPPIVEKGGPVWDLAQVYAVRDKALPPAARPIAAAFRAAIAAQQPGGGLFDDQAEKDRALLNRRFGPKAEASK